MEDNGEISALSSVAKSIMGFDTIVGPGTKIDSLV